VASHTPCHKRRHPATDIAGARLALAAGLLLIVVGAGAADDLARSESIAERAGMESIRAQPIAEQFEAPNQPATSASDARFIDELYRQLIGPPPATSSGFRSSSHLQEVPKDYDVGSVRRWASPQ
jgi:hypothetical protein